MTVMVSTLARCLRGSVVATLGCVLVTATALIGCSRTIDGTVRAAPTDAGSKEPIPLADLLIEPARFPARYPAVVLDPPAVDRVFREIDGAAAGSVVTPPECAPPPVAAEAAAVAGIDSQNARSLIVAVSRTGAPLRGRIDQLAGCPGFTSVAGPDRSSVRMNTLPMPPVDADESYAVDQTVTSPTSGSMTRTLTLVAQIADVRVSATWLQDGTPDTTPYATPETEPLDTLFTDAVLKVRRDGQP